MSDIFMARDFDDSKDGIPDMELPEYHSTRLLHSRHTSQTPLMSASDTEDTHDADAHANEHTNDGSPKIPPCIFDRRRQVYSLLWPQSLRWLGTVVIAALLMMTMKIYQDKGNFSQHDKIAYNVIFTGLSIGLGINFFEAFKGAAKILRWKALADAPHSVRMLDLILSMDSLEKVCNLGLESLSVNLWTSLACIAWISLNLAAQIAVALAGLTINLVDGNDWSGTYVQNDIVNATNLTCYFNRLNPARCPGRASIEDTAHIYGEQSVSSTCLDYSVIADVLNSDQNPGYYCRRTPGNQEFAYRFKEWNPTDITHVFPYLTNRTITASSGQCITYNMTNQTSAPDMNQDGDGYLFTYSNGTYTGNISIPTANLGEAGTTYIYRDVNDPTNADVYRCGERCLRMWAYKNPGDIHGDSAGRFYECPITVSAVGNSSDAAHDVGNNVALIAAASIALQGRWSPAPNGGQIHTQYQYVPFDTPWDIHYQDASDVGANMAEFAIGSVSQLATFNPPIQIQGHKPYLGSQLQVNWPYVIALFLGVIVVHFVLYITSIWSARNVVVTDESFLSIARLLRNLLDSVGESGTYLEGKQISHALQERMGPTGFVYGPKSAAAVGHGQEFQLEIGQDVPTRNMWPRGRHPDGMYQ